MKIDEYLTQFIEKISSEFNKLIEIHYRDDEK